jgi:hypothetical protein
MKNILTCLLIICSVSVKSEYIDLIEKLTFVLPFTSKVVTNDLPCKNAIVNIYVAENFDIKIDSTQVIQTLKLNDDGILNIDIPGNVDYIIEITKPGYVHKLFRINTQNVPEDMKATAFAGFSIQSISLFKPTDGVNYKLLDLPLVLISYDDETENFNYDENYSNIALASLELLSDLETAHKDGTKTTIEELEKKHNSFKYKTILFAGIFFTLGITLFLRILRQKR